MRSEKDIQAILGNWDIPKGLEIEDVSTKDWKTAKIVCETWKVGGKYYLKTSERSKMIRNIKIAKALKNEGLLSEFLPISTVAGDDYLDGEHIFLLTAKIGEPLDNRPLSNDEVATVDNNLSREKYAYKLGQSIAKLHRALKSVQDDIKPDEINLYKQVVKAIPKVKEYSIKYSMKTDEDFFDDYIKNFGELHETLPRQLIHGNLVGESAVYENDEVVCFKGFEIYNISNIRLFDAVYCAGETNTQPLESYLEILKNILKGYDSVNSLTMQEKQSVYYVLCSIGMNMLAYCDETLDVSKRNREALVLLSKNKEKFFNLI